MLREDLAGAPQRAADDLAEIVQRGVRHDRAGFELGHVEQIGDEAVEPLGFVDDGAEQVALLGVGQRRWRGRAASPAAPSTAASGVLRSCEIEVSSAERSRSVSTVRLTRSMSSTRCTRSIASAPWSISASSSRRWSGVSSGPVLSLSMPTTPIGAAPGAHRQEQPLGAGQRVGAAAGRAVVLPGPVGGGEIGLVERVLRRVAGLDRDRAVLRQQQHHAHLQHQRDLVGGGPQHVVERAGAGELAAEGVERLGGARRAPIAAIGLRAHARGEIGDQRSRSA